MINGKNDWNCSKKAPIGKIWDIRSVIPGAIVLDWRRPRRPAAAGRATRTFERRTRLLCASLSCLARGLADLHLSEHHHRPQPRDHRPAQGGRPSLGGGARHSERILSLLGGAGNVRARHRPREHPLSHPVVVRDVRRLRPCGARALCRTPRPERSAVEVGEQLSGAVGGGCVAENSERTGVADGVGLGVPARVCLDEVEDV